MEAPPKNEQIVSIYVLLISLIQSLTPSITQKTLRDGSGEKFNSYLSELFEITNDSRLNDFQVKVRIINGHSTTYGEEYVRSLFGAVNYIYRTNDMVGYYASHPPTNKLSDGAGGSQVVNNQFTAEQQMQQTTTVHVEFNQTIISLAERLTNLERDHPDKSSKENKFAIRLKQSLPAVKDTLDIVALVLKITGEVGLRPESALKLLGLS